MRTRISTGRALSTALALAFAIGAAAPIAFGSSEAGAQQFEGPWNFTARDRRVAIALAIKQVEDGLLGPGRIENNTTMAVCGGGGGTSSGGGAAAGSNATANSACKIIIGDNSSVGDTNQDNSGSIGADSGIGDGSGNVGNNNGVSGLDGVAAALQGKF